MVWYLRERRGYYPGWYMERQRVTVQEAARILGVKEPAIRKRVKRGTLQSERVGERVYVYLDTGESADRSEDRSAGRDELVKELRSQIEYLREENRRKDHLLAAALERIPPQLEAPSEPTGSPVTPSGSGRSSETHPALQEATERLPGWRRVVGG
jgi:excisionase family DNA binding protein